VPLATRAYALDSSDSGRVARRRSGGFDKGRWPVRCPANRAAFWPARISPIWAIVPANVAAAGAAALEALEDADDLAAAEVALAEWEADDRRTYSLADIDAELGEN
jgi:hypothetical protein